jgi:hypothetical protein
MEQNHTLVTKRSESLADCFEFVLDIWGSMDEHFIQQVASYNARKRYTFLKNAVLSNVIAEQVQSRKLAKYQPSIAETSIAPSFLSRTSSIAPETIGNAGSAYISKSPSMASVSSYRIQPATSSPSSPTRHANFASMQHSGFRPASIRAPSDRRTLQDFSSVRARGLRQIMPFKMNLMRNPSESDISDRGVSQDTLKDVLIAVSIYLLDLCKDGLRDKEVDLMKSSSKTKFSNVTSRFSSQISNKFSVSSPFSGPNHEKLLDRMKKKTVFKKEYFDGCTVKSIIHSLSQYSLLLGSMISVRSTQGLVKLLQDIDMSNLDSDIVFNRVLESLSLESDPRKAINLALFLDILNMVRLSCAVDGLTDSSNGLVERGNSSSEITHSSFVLESFFQGYINSPGAAQESCMSVNETINRLITILLDTSGKLFSTFAVEHYPGAYRRKRDSVYISISRSIARKEYGQLVNEGAQTLKCKPMVTPGNSEASLSFTRIDECEELSSTREFGQGSPSTIVLKSQCSTPRMVCNCVLMLARKSGLSLFLNR